MNGARRPARWTRRQADMAAARPTASRTALPTAFRTALSVALSAVLLVGCTQSGSQSSPSPSPTPEGSAPRQSRSAPPPSPSAEETTKTPRIDHTDPEQVAQAFVASFVLRRHDDPSPRQYLKRIRPYATPGFIEELRESTSERCNLACQEDKKRRVRMRADNMTARISREAPRSRVEVWVQVAYDRSTTWRGGGDAVRDGMSLRLRKTDGKWLVAERRQAG